MTGEQRKSKLHPSYGYVFNIETGKAYVKIPREATASDLPLYARSSDIVKNNSYRDAVIIDLRKKLNKVKENIKNCDHDTLIDLCEISSLIDIHANHLYDEHSFDLLDRDVMRTREVFIENCKLFKNLKRE